MTASDEVFEVASKLAARREALGLTKTQLAGELGVTRDTVRRWESGQASPASATLLRWKAALGEELEVPEVVQPTGDTEGFDHPDWTKMRTTLVRMRRAASMTQGEVAAEMGVTGNTLSLWENGHRTPDVKHLIGWAAVFGLGVEIPVYDRWRQRRG